MFAEVVLDDTWADGTHTDTNLPDESAWYISSSSDLSAVPGTMTATTAVNSNRTWWTYFTETAAGPVHLATGDTLKATMVFTPDTVNTGNLKRGLSIGLYDFTGGTRTTASSGSPGGAGVTGYMMNLNFARTIGVEGPLELRQRTTISNSNLMSSSSAYTTLGTGGPAVDEDEFIGGTEYTLEVIATRTASGVALTITVSDSEGWSMSHTETATTDVVDQFDGFAVRATKSTETAASLAITRFKVERIPGGPIAPSIATQPQNQSVAQGQNAAFSVSANGSAPLSYSWKKDPDNITIGTAATLNLPDVQLGDAGNYTVTVTNDFGSITSNAATLTVTVPTPPSINTQPQSVTVNAGQNAAFSVTAEGSPPFSYQWFKGGQPVAGGTTSTLTIINAQAANAGSYTVTVTNAADSTTSNPATLTVDSVAPSIVTPPASRAATVGDAVTFTVAAAGTEPFTYQWRKDGSPIAGATSASLILSGVQESDSADYSVAVTNSVGTTVSADAALTVTTGLPESAYNLEGFAQATTGGGVLADTHADYMKVYDATDFHTALDSDTVKVIEIMNDLDLGYEELPAAVQNGPFRINKTPLLHPVLLVSGVSLIDVADKEDLTIFSANGATLRHAELNVKRCTNLIIRNLKFAEMWEWDESSKGDYDRNDWDLITVDMASTKVWIDHCDFYKAYDGVVDIKGGSNKVTISWCRFLQDDGAAGSWVRQQIDFLEANRAANPMYDFLRTNGFSEDDIVEIARFQKKGHLVGATEFASSNADLSVTLHHNLYRGMNDRLPRLRAGNAHVYSIHADNRDAYAASLLYAARVAAMSSGEAQKLSNGTYKFSITQNGSISTEGGAVLVEKSYYDGVRYALRNNQADTSDSDYTGKIRAVDLIFKFDTIDFRGGSDDAGHPLGPTQAPEILPFSFNGFGSLPYSYTTHEPDQVPEIIVLGGGAGTVLWSKDNWLATSYSGSSVPVAPVITTQPANQALVVGGTASFTVGATGTPTLSYQWRKDGTPIDSETNSTATNSTLTLTNVQPSDAVAYSVVVTNSQGSATSNAATLSVNTSFNSWRQEQFNETELADQDTSGPDAILTADGVANLMKYALGVDAYDSALDALPKVGLDAGGNPVFRYRRVVTASDLTHLPVVSEDLEIWSTANVSNQLITPADAEGIEQWEAQYTGPEVPGLFFVLSVSL